MLLVFIFCVSTIESIDRAATVNRTSSSSAKSRNATSQFFRTREKEKLPKVKSALTCLHLCPARFFAGPSMPHAHILKNQNVPTMLVATIAKMPTLVRSVNRRDLKKKWSSKTPTIKTENHSVGNWGFFFFGR